MNFNEQFSRQFFDWEIRGRGWRVFDRPVAHEPPFRHFSGYSLPHLNVEDEGRRHSLASGFLDLLRRMVTVTKAAEAEPHEAPEPDVREAHPLVELQLSLPRSGAVPKPDAESFIRHVARGGEPLSFEILGTPHEIVPQWVVPERSAGRVKSALLTSFPGIICLPVEANETSDSALARAWEASGPRYSVVELGLGREFLLPLGAAHNGVLGSVVAAMHGVEEQELALLQILFEPLQAPWIESMRRSVIRADGQPFFTERRDLINGLQAKIASPLYGVVVRLASVATDVRRMWEIIADIAAALSVLAKPGTNYLIPLSNEGYPALDHEADVLNRLSRRSGMILSLDELAPLVTSPTASLAPKLRREIKPTRPPPEMLPASGLRLGTNIHQGRPTDVYLSSEHRVRHMHLIGASGTGKSTLLLNLIQQDVRNGEGLAVFDPHGDLIDAVIERIPAERVEDVILLDPSDEHFSIGFNILAAHSDFEKSLLASDLTSVFRRLSTSWGDQMESVLRNAILAFLESSRAGTLIDLRRFLIDAAFRKDFVSTIEDPEIAYYWNHAFPQLTGGKSIGPILTRLDEFLSRKPLRYMVAQEANKLDFAEILDKGRILLIRLPQGLIGRENTALLGSLMTAKLQMAAMSRQRMTATARRDFWVYMDEFQNFITPSMAEILAGARKYRMGLILAHQELRQLDADRDVASAVLSTCYTRAVFNVGDADARTLENGFAHFEARDIMNLGVGTALCRVERSEYDFNLEVPQTTSTDSVNAESLRGAIISSSREKYARRREEVEAELAQKRQSSLPVPKSRTRNKSSPRHEAVERAEAEIHTEPTTPATPPARSAPSYKLEGTSQLEGSHLPERTIRSDVPKELGRGGVQHTAIQGRIKDAAEKLGFRTIVEKSTRDRRGSIDLLLERGGLSIACEISISTTIDHEVGNVQKCSKAGYASIAVICTEADRLRKIEAAVKNSLGETTAAKTRYFLPDEFIAHLETIPLENPAEPKQKVSRGYKIKSVKVPLPPEELRHRETEFLEIIARNLRRPSEPA